MPEHNDYQDCILSRALKLHDKAQKLLGKKETIAPKDLCYLAMKIAFDDSVGLIAMNLEPDEEEYEDDVPNNN